MYVKTKNLPATVQAVLKRHGYHRPDVMVKFQESVGTGSYSDKGSRSYVTTVNTTMGSTKTLMGNWGGPTPFDPENVVDNDTQDISLARDLWVIKGSEGYRSHATIYVHPDARPDFAYTGAAEPTESERKVLEAYKTLRSGPYRKEALARIPNLDATLKACVAKGFLKQSKNGACRITTEGKNAVA